MMPRVGVKSTWTPRSNFPAPAHKIYYQVLLTPGLVPYHVWEPPAIAQKVNPPMFLDMSGKQINFKIAEFTSREKDLGELETYHKYWFVSNYMW